MSLQLEELEARCVPTHHVTVALHLDGTLFVTEPKHGHEHVLVTQAPDGTILVLTGRTVYRYGADAVQAVRFTGDPNLLTNLLPGQDQGDDAPQVQGPSQPVFSLSLLGLPLGSPQVQAFVQQLLAWEALQGSL